MASNRRLTKELGELGEDPIDGCDVGPSGDDIYQWTAMLSGPEGSPYEEGIFELAVEIPVNYPFKAPHVRFVTPVYHPNIKSDDGRICADIFENGWVPTLNIRYILSRIQQLLVEPNPESPLEPQIANQYMTDREAFNAAAREHTAKHAGV